MRTKKLTSDGTVIKRKKLTAAESREQEKINLVRLLFKQAAGQPMTATDMVPRLETVRTMFMLWLEHSAEHNAAADGPWVYRMMNNITELVVKLKAEGIVADSVEASAQYALVMAKESDLDFSALLESPEKVVC